MSKPVYFDTSVFLEMGKRNSKYKKRLKELLKDLQERKVQYLHFRLDCAGGFRCSSSQGSNSTRYYC